ncbi:hypothetical protein [Apilactobacillus timberlakei]|uniref:hypothetical protein n=1 Tax=Apilactobacillus timberlakei TaxID=2008380 RepID=UPI00112A4493|nr:hypothetical protein [Apilactobacillus timberlakei]TPR16675.1 hypothetical protein DYZ95_07480 [Apilactobacillus timberlakei]
MAVTFSYDIDEDELDNFDTDGEWREDMYDYFIVDHGNLIKPFYESIKSYLLENIDYYGYEDCLDTDEHILDEFEEQCNIEQAITNRYSRGWRNYSIEKLLHEVEHD